MPSVWALLCFRHFMLYYVSISFHSFSEEAFLSGSSELRSFGSPVCRVNQHLRMFIAPTDFGLSLIWFIISGLTPSLEQVDFKLDMLLETSSFSFSLPCTWLCVFIKSVRQCFSFYAIHICSCSLVLVLRLFQLKKKLCNSPK